MLDEAARKSLEELYRVEGVTLWKAVLAFSGSRDVADEAVAEAFAQAGRRFDQLASPKPWLYAAAFHIARGLLKSGREVGLYALEPPGGAIAGDDEAQVDLLQLLRILTPMQRGCFVLRELLGYESIETARILGTSSGAVRVHLHGARKRLRGVIDEG